MAVAVNRHRFTVDQYHRMLEARILTKDDRVELIEGEILEMAPIGTRHASTVDRITRLLITRLGDRAIVRVQGPIVLPVQVSEPQPDVAVLRPRADFYRAAHPQPDGVLLVIEVADTTVEPDRRCKSDPISLDTVSTTMTGAKEVDDGDEQAEADSWQ